MTQRLDTSLLYNRWHDSQRVDQNDLSVEQFYNTGTNASIIHNHFGSGVLLESPEQRVLFDSDDLTSEQAAILAAGNFDGIGLDAHLQPSDINLGNQIEVELSDSSAMGRFSVKVAIIGLSFDDELQIDRFYFYRNEKQVTSRHYKRILTIFFNDFKGNTNCSRVLGGSIVIREAASFQLSRDPIMSAQDVEPDIFWRDFKVSDVLISLFDILQNGIGPEYDADALNINITAKTERELIASDVTSHIGQKFQAETDNIQKITLLLGVRRNDLAEEDDIFDWAGDLVISIYPLQTTVGCPTDIVPELAIEFDPSNQPIAQLSYNQFTLEDYGYVLNEVAQPVDFVFNATKLGAGSTSGIVIDDFYAITIKRSGAANNGTIFISVGNDRVDNSRLTVYGGSTWTDVAEEDLWYQVWTDAAKIADGRGYDEGAGIQYDKTVVDQETAATIDNQITDKSFADTGENVLNIGIIQATIEESITVQDERTGNNINSRQKFVPSFSFVNEANLSSLQETSDPLIIGCAEDINPKQNPELERIQYYPGMAQGDVFKILNPDPDLLSLNLVGSKLIPNQDNCNLSYKIAEVKYCIDGYGDVLRDGYIDINDIAALSALIGEGVNSPSTQQKIADGEIDIISLLAGDLNGDGYITSEDVDLLTQYVNKQINAFPVGSSFDHLELTVGLATGRYDGYYSCVDGYIRLDGYTGLNVVESDDLSAFELLYDGYGSSPVLEIDSVFSAIPFIPVSYKIKPLPFWQPYFVLFDSHARIVPSIFSSQESLEEPECTSTSIATCQDRANRTLDCDPGRNDFFVPNDLIIGGFGNIKRPNGDLVKLDFEIGTIILQLPEVPLEEVLINIFDKFVAENDNSGLTMASYPALRYGDCSFVQQGDLELNRVRFGVAIQSWVGNLDGYESELDAYVVIVDNIIGVYMDQSTGILRLSAQDLAADEIFQTLVTKIEINVFLKKAGWNNQVLIIQPSEIEGLISS